MTNPDVPKRQREHGPRNPLYESNYFGAYLLHSLKLILATTLALWVVDVLVNLALLERSLLGNHLPARVRDFVGLFVAETQVAVSFVVLSMIAATTAAWLLRNRSATRESVAITAALSSAAVMLAGMRVAWHFDRSELRLAFAVALVIGGCAWIAVRTGLKWRPRGPWSFADTLQTVLLPLLVLGFLNQTAAHVVQARWVDSLIAALAALCVLILTVAANRRGGPVSLPYVGRRRIITVAAWCPVVVAALLCAYACNESRSYGRFTAVINEGSSSRLPNIVLIVLDTVRADHLRRYGYERNTMPALETWADNAMVARRAVSPAGWTSPAHASMLSGKPVSLHGIHYGSRESSFVTSAVGGIEWLPERLADAGYYRLAVTANPFALGPALRKGFSRVLAPTREPWLDSTVGGLVDHFSPLMQRLNERIRWRMPYLDAKQIVDIVVRAVPDGDAPVFLFVNFMDAHAPYNPPTWALKQLEIRTGHIFGRYRSHRELTSMWPRLQGDKKRHLSDLYDGELRGMDTHLGRLLEWIDYRLGADTVVIVTSDHGEELGEASRVGHEYGLAQALLHVPLFVRAPAIPAGPVESVISLRSLYGFILALTRGEEAKVSNLTRGDDFGVIAERYVSGQNTRSLGAQYGRPWVALFDHGYKGVGPSDEGFELFDVHSSSFDTALKVGDLPGSTIIRLRVDDYWGSHKDRREDLIKFASPTKEEQERLRSLGYIR